MIDAQIAMDEVIAVIKHNINEDEYSEKTRAFAFKCLRSAIHLGADLELLRLERLEERVAKRIEKSPEIFK